MKAKALSVVTTRKGLSVSMWLMLVERKISVWYAVKNTAAVKIWYIRRAQVKVGLRLERRYSQR
jgi:hypothetical protein